MRGIIKRCSRTEDGKQCLKEAGHQLITPCQFVDGAEALATAMRAEFAVVKTEGNLQALGIGVIGLADANTVSLEPERAPSAGIFLLVAYDYTGNLTCYSFEHKEAGSGLERVTHYIRLRGGAVKFGVGMIIISDGKQPA